MRWWLVAWFVDAGACSELAHAPCFDLGDSGGDADAKPESISSGEVLVPQSPNLETLNYV